MMGSSYHIDASKFTLQQLKSNLQGRELIPSRKPLKNNLEVNFQALEMAGLFSLGDLLACLKGEKGIAETSVQTGIEEGYLVLLRREANSYFPKPVQLIKFGDRYSEDAFRLAAEGIKNSRQLFEWIESEKTLESLSLKTGIALSRLSRLASFSDLVRVYGVGPVFAGLLYDAGLRSLDDFLFKSPTEIIELYEEKTGKKADFSREDLQFSQDQARYLQTG